MLISTLNSNNLADYKHFFQQGLQDYPQCFRLTIADDQQEGFPTRDTADSFTLVALSDLGKWVGIVSFKTEYDNRENLTHKGLLFRMYVAESGLGIGAALITALLNQVKQHGIIEQINLTVESENQRAIELYTRFGFKQYGLEVNSIKRGEGVYQSEILMKLDLKP